MKKLIFTIATMFCFGIFAQANNIKILNVNVVGTNVTFDISWENSWNSTTNIDLNYPNNWDAAWVFVKVQSNLDNLWKHQNVATTATHTITGGVLQVDPVTDGVGVFIRRSAAGNGNVSATATISMQTLPAGTLNFRVFGIEMVQIPQGNFAAGDSATGGNRFFNYNVTSAAIPTSGLFTGSPSLPTAYPRGYESIYAAKYETSLGQYTDYLNTLTYDQQANYTDVAPNAVSGTRPFGAAANGNTVIEIDTPGVNNTSPAVYGCDGNNNSVYNDPSDFQNAACGIFTIRRGIAYLDWTGLRPMTELEFEKICRGTKFNGAPNPRVPGEYPWGTTEHAQYYRSNVSFLGTDSARVTAAVVNGRVISGASSFVLAQNAGVVRVGQFANLSTGRAASGAGFYGNMDMAGNVYESCITVNSTSNPATMTSLGDGNLVSTPGPTNGDGNVAGWSDYSATTYWGARGGEYLTLNPTGTSLNQTSNRQSIPYSAGTLQTTSVNVGIRGVR